MLKKIHEDSISIQEEISVRPLNARDNKYICGCQCPADYDVPSQHFAHSHGMRM
jgi:hypothetical protein